MKIFNRMMFVFMLIGLGSGLLVDILYRFQVFELFFYCFILSAALSFCLCYNEDNIFRLVLTSMVTASLVSLPFFSFDWNVLEDLNRQTFSFLAAFPLYFYCIHAFHYNFHYENAIKLNYKQLFLAFINTISLVIIAASYLVIVNAILMLIAIVFKSVNFSIIWDIYLYYPHMLFLLNVVLFFIGLSIGLIHSHLLDNLRYFLLRLMHLLLPLIAVVTMVYFFLYWFHYILGNASFIPTFYIVLPLCFLGLLFFNGYYQDGENKESYPWFVDRTVKVYRIVLFFITLMLCHVVWLHAYLFPNLLLFMAVIIALSFLYALTVFMPDNMEKRMITKFNTSILLFFVTMMLILNNPFVPARIYTSPTDKTDNFMEIKKTIEKNIDELKKTTGADDYMKRL
jgi:hypothetical protein